MSSSSSAAVAAPIPLALPAIPKAMPKPLAPPAVLAIAPQAMNGIIVPVSDDLDLTMELERIIDLSEAEHEMKVRCQQSEVRWENTELLGARAMI